jgi:eukaryotic-like serine/threonine-protein kinase
MIGKSLGHYRIIEKLGSGGMGVVYKAEDTILGRYVALKFLPAEVLNSPAASERFLREAKASAALNHPNICVIYEAGIHEGQHYISMELLEGQTLRQQISMGRLSMEDLLEDASQIAGALNAAHSKGIIHRDIKPGNIFILESGQIKLLDFGLAKFHAARQQASESTASTEEPITTPGSALGTVSYMSPEQARGEEVDARTDLFSFGVVVYEMATGSQAFSGNTSAVIFDGILHKAPTSPVMLNPEVPGELERIINKAIEKDKKLRYQSASDMQVDLKRLQRDSDSGHSAAGTVPFPKKKRRLVIGASIIVAVLALAVTGYFYLNPTPKLTEKDSIILAEFSNRTGDPLFDLTLQQGLSTALQQSPFLRIVSGDMVTQTLRFMKKPPDTQLIKPLAREVCQRVSATATIEGNIAMLGSEYVIGLDAVNCSTGETVAQQQVTVKGKEKVLAALGEAASGLRSKLGESRASLARYDVPLDRATTPSLEALQALSRAHRAFDKGDWMSAKSLAERAVALDPSFALGYSFLGAMQSVTGQSAQAFENIKKSYDLRDRANEMESYLISIVYYRDGLYDLEKALEIAQQLNQAYPHQAYPLIFLSHCYYLLGRNENAATPILESIKMEPNSVSLSLAVNVCLATNRLEQVKTIIQDARKQMMDIPRYGYVSYMIAMRQNDTNEMAANQAAMRQYMGSGGFELEQEAYKGRLSQLRSLLRSKMMPPKQVVTVARQFALIGLASEAKDALKELKTPMDQDVEGNAAITLALAGDSKSAERLVADLSRRFPEATIVRRCYLPYVRAALALKQGKQQDAIDQLFPLASYDMMNDMTLVYLRGEAYLSNHQGKLAAAEFQKMLDHPVVGFSISRNILPRLGLARAYALDGEIDKARTMYQDFLGGWKDADADIPILKQARAEFSNLEQKQKSLP